MSYDRESEFGEKIHLHQINLDEQIRSNTQEVLFVSGKINVIMELLGDIKNNVNDLNHTIYKDTGKAILPRLAESELRVAENAKKIDIIMKTQSEISAERIKNDRLYRISIFSVLSLLIVYIFDNNLFPFIKSLLTVIPK